MAEISDHSNNFVCPALRGRRKISLATDRPLAVKKI
jgi:hypothetical protein